MRLVDLLQAGLLTREGFDQSKARLLQHGYAELNDLESGQSLRSGPDPS
jgi:hypothetical protein